jgi:hypothetical protein
VAIDSSGDARPDWAAAFHQRPLGARPITDKRTEDGDWRGMVR